jgi:putative sterol carrier protein
MLPGSASGSVGMHFAQLNVPFSAGRTVRASVAGWSDLADGGHDEPEAILLGRLEVELDLVSGVEGAETKAP